MRLVIWLAVLSVVFVGVVVASGAPKTPGDCTWTGTPGRDVKTGTDGANVLCSEAGDDFVHGRAGNDRLRAGAGNDTAVGGGGRDIIRGGKGSDKLFAVDDQGGERVVCGPGVDRAFVDRGDLVFGCETTFRSKEPEMATALAQSLGTVMEIAEVSGSPSPIPPPVVTVTTIVPPPNCGGHPAPPPIC